jgi:hypothetical protein
MNDILEHYREALIKAERAIKYAECCIDSFTDPEGSEDDCCQFNTKINSVVVPAVNELRYAAKHISKIFYPSDSSQINTEELDKAIRHCVRAKYDALHAISLYLIRDFQHFIRDYQESSEALDAIEGFTDHCVFVEQTLLYISEIADYTDEVCEELMEKIKRLKQLYLITKSARATGDSVYTKLELQIKKLEVQNKQAKWWTMLWALAGIAIGAVITYLLK